MPGGERTGQSRAAPPPPDQATSGGTQRLTSRPAHDAVPVVPGHDPRINRRTGLAMIPGSSADPSPRVLPHGLASDKAVLAPCILLIWNGLDGSAREGSRRGAATRGPHGLRGTR